MIEISPAAKIHTPEGHVHVYYRLLIPRGNRGRDFSPWLVAAPMFRGHTPGASQVNPPPEHPFMLITVASPLSYSSTTNTEVSGFSVESDQYRLAFLCGSLQSPLRASPRRWVNCRHRYRGVDQCHPKVQQEQLMNSRLTDITPQSLCSLYVYYVIDVVRYIFMVIFDYSSSWGLISNGHRCRGFDPHPQHPQKLGWMKRC